MKRNPIEVFSQWADLDKDFGMEKNHYKAVENMLTFTQSKTTPFSFIDAGCGNGWVVRSLTKNAACNLAMGVDGSKKMIAKAKKIDPKGMYICADLMSWIPNEKVDIVHSMEVFYYVENPQKLIQQIFDKWLKQTGTLVIGLDFYTENTISHSWPEDCGIAKMKLFSEKEWVSFFKDAGFSKIKSWRFGTKKDWGGSLIITGTK